MKKIFKIIYISFFSMIIFVIMVVLLVYIYENRQPNYIKLKPSEIHQYTNNLDKNGLAPGKYVIQKFKKHPVVILGEPHRIHEHYQFLLDIMDSLQENGINQVAIEFFLISSQAKIDQLMNSKEFDPKLAREIILNCVPLFYFDELYQIVKKAWSLNQNGKSFSIIALYVINNRDHRMAEIINSRIQGGKKILVYCGTHHAFTKYYQPGLNPWKKPNRVVRMGQYLYHEYKVNPYFINLHYPMFKKFYIVIPRLLYQKGWVLSFSGELDQVFESYGKPVGFDSNIDGFKNMTESFSYYSNGYGSITLENYCDGYIYLNPITQYTFVKPIEHLAGTENDIVIYESTVDQCYSDPSTRERMKKFFNSEEKAMAIMEHNGISPEEMLEMLDTRGLEFLFDKNQKK